MTGIYVRIQRDDESIENVEIDQMTDTELRRFADKSRQNNSDGWSWVIALARWIRDNIQESNLG